MPTTPKKIAPVNALVVITAIKLIEAVHQQIDHAMKDLKCELDKLYEMLAELSADN